MARARWWSGSATATIAAPSSGLAFHGGGDGRDDGPSLPPDGRIPCTSGSGGGVSNLAPPHPVHKRRGDFSNLGGGGFNSRSTCTERRGGGRTTTAAAGREPCWDGAEVVAVWPDLVVADAGGVGGHRTSAGLVAGAAAAGGRCSPVIRVPVASLSCGVPGSGGAGFAGCRRPGSVGAAAVPWRVPLVPQGGRGFESFFHHL
uniref:Uncharacterized protein n=1 Tax=Arundo donax TaxID=35708 RepID=A0A0A9GLH0_ARUDO